MLTCTVVYLYALMHSYTVYSIYFVRHVQVRVQYVQAVLAMCRQFGDLPFYSYVELNSDVVEKVVRLHSKLSPPRSHSLPSFH